MKTDACLKDVPSPMHEGGSLVLGTLCFPVSVACFTELESIEIAGNTSRGDAYCHRVAQGGHICNT